MDDFVKKLTPAIKNDLNQEEQKKLNEACQIVSDLIKKIKESEDKLKESEDKLKESEDKLEESENKLNLLNFTIKKNNKEFERKQGIIEELQTEISDLEEKHKERIEEMLKERKETVDKLQKELLEAKKNQFIIKT